MNTERALGTQRRKQLILAEEVGEGFTREDTVIELGLEECAWGGLISWDGSKAQEGGLSQAEAKELWKCILGEADGARDWGLMSGRENTGG